MGSHAPLVPMERTVGFRKGCLESGRARRGISESCSEQAAGFIRRGISPRCRSFGTLAERRRAPRQLCAGSCLAPSTGPVHILISLLTSGHQHPPAALPMPPVSLVPSLAVTARSFVSPEIPGKDVRGSLVSCAGGQEGTRWLHRLQQRGRGRGSPAPPFHSSFVPVGRLPGCVPLIVPQPWLCGIPVTGHQELHTIAQLLSPAEEHSPYDEQGLPAPNEHRHQEKPAGKALPAPNEHRHQERPAGKALATLPLGPSFGKGTL
ncbi:hypothetical protein Anapl_13141 [Anas platyrhynchos]|uniref:Uncharacterized protein n=1 Tax=Anas platyrhynchos TaxID=8839 RepID=R0LN19_ANAPL|nr:hypothetical protein Anapl_13141 [Anas platyrhynchos]